jgi:hypothetical protein
LLVGTEWDVEPRFLMSRGCGIGRPISFRLQATCRAKVGVAGMTPPGFGLTINGWTLDCWR